MSITLGPNTLPSPRPWQEQVLRTHTENKWAIFADPRIGKTYVGATWMRKLLEDDPHLQGLVSAPLRVCPLWEETLQAAGIPTIPLYDLTAAKARTLLKQPHNGVIVLNIDKLWPLRDLLYHNTQIYICDEVHETASPSAHRALSARRIAHNATYVLPLTATPAPNHKGNLWSPLNMIGAFPKTWTEFQERYLIRDMMFPSIVKDYINVEELETLIVDHSAIVPRSSVFGPDSYQFIYRDVKLPPATMNMYRKLAKEWILENPNVVADHTLTRLLRLHQLTSGFLIDADGQEVLIHSTKLDAALADLGEIIEAGEKAVIFHRFKREGEIMGQSLRLNVPTFYINGQYDAHASEEQRAAFTRQEGAAVIIVQIQSGGVGISLAEADHALYLSRDFSFVHDEQSRDRIYKPGASRTITYYEVPGTIDKTISRALAHKRDMHDSIKALSSEAIVFGE